MSTPFSCEDYLFLLQKKAAIPLEQIPLEQDSILMREGVAWLKKQYKSDKRAFAALRDQYKNVRLTSQRSAENLVEKLKFATTMIPIVALIYTETGLSELELINTIGVRDFMKRYVEFAPRFRHLKVMKEARLMECMDKNSYREYFLKEIASRLVEQEDTGEEACSCECLFHLIAPELAGCSVLEWVKRNVKYPMFAMQNDIQGKAHVSFLVGCDGKISHAFALPGGEPSFDQEALRVIKCLPRFIPSKCSVHHRRVAVLYVLPINFCLQ